MGKIDIALLEEELTSSVDGLSEEKILAKSNYQAIDDTVKQLIKKIPYPDVTQYSIGIDYEDISNLQSKKRANKRHEEIVQENKKYSSNGSLYCGHIKLNDTDHFIMEGYNYHSTTFTRSDGSELHLINVNDETYQDYIILWRYPDKGNINLSRNITLSNRNVKNVDVVYDETSSAYSEITDGYLRNALFRNKTNSNAESIIQTIQKTQNHIRSLDSDKAFIVQGCAGSGKTMVLLHRLEYLIYNKQIRNDDYIFLIPGQQFMDFIDNISSKFNINKKNILSYQQYYGNVLNKDIPPEDIADELIFDKEYLAHIYSEKFIKDCYLVFFENILNQTENLISYCDEVLTSTSEKQLEKLNKNLKKVNNKVLKNINKLCKMAKPYTDDLAINSINEVDEYVESLKRYYIDLENTILDIEYLPKVDNNEYDDLLLEDDTLIFLQHQIMQETESFQKASIFTRKSHQRKLEQLNIKYNEYREVIKSELIKNNGNTERKHSIMIILNNMKKIELVKLSNIIKEIETIKTESIIEYKALEMDINKFSDSFERKYFTEIDALNSLIEHSTFFSDNELQLINSLKPCNDFIFNLQENGRILFDAFKKLEEDTEDERLEEFILFNAKSNAQLYAYITNLIFNSMKKNIYENFKVKLSNIYKHYWYLSLYSRYLSGGLKLLKRKHIFIDEAQDLSPMELKLIYNINTTFINGVEENPIFNLFGDVNQTISQHGVKNWNDARLGLNIYSLNENFRNTNQIVDYCNELLPYKMTKIGVDMDEVSIYSNLYDVRKMIGQYHSHIIVIVKDEYTKEDFIKENLFYYFKSTVYTVKEVKGLEFKEVYVFDKNMNDNEKYISYTRALAKLNIIKELPKSTKHETSIISGDDNY